MREAVALVRRTARSGTTGTAELRARVWRQVGVQRHLAGATAVGRKWVHRSLAVAERSGLGTCAAEALNTLAGLAIDEGQLAAAALLLARARRAAPPGDPLHASLAMNLAIIASIRGQGRRAERRYRLAYRLARAAGRADLAAAALLNLALIAEQRGDGARAGTLGRRAARMADRLGDGRTLGLAQLAVVRSLIATERLRAAELLLRRAAGSLRAARAVLDFPEVWVLAARIARVQELPRAAALARHAEARAARFGLPLAQAEALRELALWHQARGDDVAALRILGDAVRAFRRAGAAADARAHRDQERRVIRQFLAVVRRWGRTLEAADAYTHGHAERVARYSVLLARVLGCSAEQRMTIRVGAYLHDIGKVRVPLAVLHKPGRLDAEERAAIEAHPLHGVAMLQDVALPWEILPIVRWHHEHADGSGYPDRLVGEVIPLSAQIVSAADVFDALTTDRPYRPALTPAAALAEMQRTRAWWSPRVLAAAELAFSGLPVPAPRVAAA